MCHLEIGQRLEVSVEGTDEGGDGLDEEEEGCVCRRQLEWGSHGCGWNVQ